MEVEVLRLLFILHSELNTWGKQVEKKKKKTIIWIINIIWIIYENERYLPVLF
jgi:hypothetical protein